MSQLVKASSTRAVATMRRWPRGPGWSRMLLVGEPRVSYDDNRVDGVGLLDLRGRRLPLATSLILETCLASRRRRTGPQPQGGHVINVEENHL